MTLTTPPVRSALICHADDDLGEEGFSRWLASFSDLRLIVRIVDPPSQFWKRLRAERARSGTVGLWDVFAFRLWYACLRRRDDRRWEAATLASLRKRYPELPSTCRIVTVDSPNRREVAEALSETAVDFAMARCKRILSRRIFRLPRKGVLVLHPGICPEYRNSHGCFWAIARGDLANVGATLLQIDDGIDTGPVLGYYRVSFDPFRETHVRIQHRVVLENLDAITDKILQFLDDRAGALATEGRPSAVWGQPRLTSYLKGRLGKAP